MKALCSLLMKVNHAKFANFNVTNMSFNTIRENKILAKISEFTVVTHFSIQLCGILTRVDSDDPVQPPFKLRISK